MACIWLLPFFPSTNRDNGYDITGYVQVDPFQPSLNHGNPAVWTEMDEGESVPPE